MMNEDGAQARTRAEMIAADIAEAIIAGSLTPGSRLDEQDLAARYGSSRTPVREAIRQLQATSLIEVRPRRGAIVTRITAAKLDELFVAMGEIEATCARLSALGMTPIERRRLQALHESMRDMVERGDQSGYAEANTNFHTLIYTGAHNPVIADIAIGLRRRLAPFRHAQFRAPGRLPRSHAEHAAVVEEIVAGHPTEAHAAMLHHVSLVEIAFEQLVPRGTADAG